MLFIIIIIVFFVLSLIAFYGDYEADEMKADRAKYNEMMKSSKTKKKKKKWLFF